MDPNTKLLLDEMKRLGERFTLLEAHVDGLGDRFKTIELKEEEAKAWRSAIDSSVADLVTKADAVDILASKVDAVDDLVRKAGDVDSLKAQISAISTRVDRVVFDRGGPVSGILPKPETGATTPPAGNPSVGPDGYFFDKQFREDGYGSVLTYTQPPGKGMPPDPPVPPSNHPFGFNRYANSSGAFTHHSTGHWPKIPFPKFDGENPKLWQSRCENYIDMCGVHKASWVHISSMYFDGPAARWLQSIEHHTKIFTWDQFCKFVHDRFGRDQHEVLIRQLFHIKQIGYVAEYVEQFAQLVDQLSAYTSSTDPLYYTLQFIDGLRDDIKPIILVQRP
jgi:hypothetical protein